MDRHNEFLIGMLLLSVFVFLVAAASLYTQMKISSGNVCGCLIPLPLFIPFLAAVGLFIGMLVYYLIFPKLENETLSREEIVSLFDGDEKKIVEELLKGDGAMLQSDLVKKTNLTKVRVHRIVKKLEERGVVKKEQHGRTNRIVLNLDF